MPKCGMWYVATREHDPEPKPGSFKCTDCKTEIKNWSGITRYFGWKQLIMKSPAWGKTVTDRHPKRPMDDLF
jgi:hypothetical protein